MMKTKLFLLSALSIGLLGAMVIGGPNILPPI